MNNTKNNHKNNSTPERRNNNSRHNRNRRRNFSNSKSREKSPKQNFSYISPRSNNWLTPNSYKFNSSPSQNKLRIYTISGVEMVGTNCTVFEYENDIVIIDAGLGFPGEFLPGVDSLVPNLTHFYDKVDRIRGIVITHGHTDHIGGLYAIIKKLGFPTIYAPKLAAELIKNKFAEHKLLNQTKIVEIDGDSSYYLGKFHVSHFRMTHTIPDNYGVVLNTPVGRVATTSDYKFDSLPYKEPTSDYGKLGKLGNEGLLLLLDESTNARKSGWSESESEIAKDIENIVRLTRGRTIVGIFSTMVNRVRQIVELAHKYNKKVGILGRSLENMVKITHKMGLLNVDNGVFADLRSLHKIPDDKVIIIATGSQGEPDAALMRIAEDRHQKIKLKSTDTVVFSSSRIPGNEKKIDRLINLIVEKQATVLTNDYLTIHATGHGHKEDHKLMLQLTKPKFILPMHGDFSMRRSVIEIAKELGYPESNTAFVRDGSVVEVDQNSCQVVGQIESTPLWVEGNRVGGFDQRIIDERLLLIDEGVVFIPIKFKESKEYSPADIPIITKGFFVQKNDEYIYKKLPPQVSDLVNGIQEKDKESIQREVIKYVGEKLIKQYDKKPLIVVKII